MGLRALSQHPWPVKNRQNVIVYLFLLACLCEIIYWPFHMWFHNCLNLCKKAKPSIKKRGRLQKQHQLSISVSLQVCVRVCVRVRTFGESVLRLDYFIWIKVHCGHGFYNQIGERSSRASADDAGSACLIQNRVRKWEVCTSAACGGTRVTLYFLLKDQWAAHLSLFNRQSLHITEHEQPSIILTAVRREELTLLIQVGAANQACDVTSAHYEHFAGHLSRSHLTTLTHRYFGE